MPSYRTLSQSVLSPSDWLRELQPGDRGLCILWLEAGHPGQQADLLSLLRFLNVPSDRPPLLWGPCPAVRSARGARAAVLRSALPLLGPLGALPAAAWCPAG